MKLHIRFMTIRPLVLIFIFMIHSPQSSGQYQIKMSVVGGGGGVTEGSGFGMLSTIGQTFIGQTESAGSHMFAGMWHQYGVVTSVKMIEDAIPPESRLEQNYPNPFNPSTTIRYSIPERTHVILHVYNTLGQEVARLIDRELEAGNHQMTFDASHLPSGVYIYRLQAGDYVAHKKLMLLK